MAARQTDSSTSARKRAPQPANAIQQATPAPAREEVSNETRYVMIQEAAYLRAERRGFEPGFELEDWLAAENEIDSLLGASGSAERQ